MRVYCAGSSKELPRVRAAMTALRMSGIDVTLDWTEGAEGWPALVEMSDAARLDASCADLGGIERADVVLVLASPHRSECMVELGYAIGRSRLGTATWIVLGTATWIVVAGARADRGVFGVLAHEEHDTDAAAIASIVRRAGR